MTADIACVIKRYIQRTKSRGLAPSLANFIEEELEFVAENTNPSNDFVNNWIAQYKRVAKGAGIHANIGKVNWARVLVASMQRAGECPMESSSSPSSNCADTTSSSASTMAPVLGPEHRNQVQELYQSLDSTKKWTLKTGKRVEDELCKVATSLVHHHAVHSLILDPTDPSTTERFTAEEIIELKSFRVPVFEELPTKLKEYLHSYIGLKDLDSLYERRNRQLFHPIREADLHWMQKSMVDLTDLFFYSVLPKADHTKSGLIHRVWGFLLTSYDPTLIDVRSGEKTSAASNERKNESRGLDSNSGEPTKLDILFKSSGDEFGCAEAALPDDTDVSEAVHERQLKLLRSLKDMFVRLVKKAPSKAREIKVCGYFIHGMSLTTVVMDSPEGHVCRVLKFPTLPFPTVIAQFSKLVVPIMTVIWQVRRMMERTMQVIGDDDTVVIPTLNAEVPQPIPRCIQSPPPPKKRRIIENL